MGVAVFLRVRACVYTLCIRYTVRTCTYVRTYIQAAPQQAGLPGAARAMHDACMQRGTGIRGGAQRKHH